ncbi:MAG: ribosome maturation factor RimM [Micromonosporaceae bacterium]
MLLAVGRIGRPHGIRGEVAVEVRTDDPAQRFAPGCVLATQPGEAGPLTVVAARPHAGGLIVRFAEVTDRDGAQRLRGVLLVIDSAEVSAPGDPDEFHDHQLVGLEVVTVDGRRVGTVTDVRHHGQDLLVIRRGNGTSPGAGSTVAGTAAGGPGATGDRAGRITANARDADDEVLVPFVAAIVSAVDLQAGQVRIDPPPGLLGDGETT